MLFERYITSKNKYLKKGLTTNSVTLPQRDPTNKPHVIITDVVDLEPTSQRNHTETP